MGLISKAVRINNANQIADGVITGTKLADDTITANKIAILDYIRALQYDVYNDAKSAIKARIDHDDFANIARFMVGADITNIDTAIYIATVATPAQLNFGAKVSAVNMLNKKLVELAAPSVAGDALSLGNASITNSEISPTANIAKSKLAVGSPQRAFGSVTIPSSGYHDITGLLTPSSYPALILGFASVSTTDFIGTSKLLLRDQANNVINNNAYANIYDSGTQRGVGQGNTNMVSALISSGQVKLSHYNATTLTGYVIDGTLTVIEL